jgi:hypothetical protein
MQKRVKREGKEAASQCKQESWHAGRSESLSSEMTRIHTRGDGKYAEVTENRTDAGATWSMRRRRRGK